MLVLAIVDKTFILLGMSEKLQLVGILNLAPDSFSGDGLYEDPEQAVKKAHEFFADGASIVDIGAEATSPEAEPITADEEWKRLRPVVQQLLPEHPDLSFSIDTYHPETVERAAEVSSGKKFYVNDITTFINPDMIYVTMEHDLHAIISHMPLAAQGNIKDAHEWLHMSDPGQVHYELHYQRELLLEAGFTRDQITLDPGIGFGKTMALNWRLLEIASRIDGNRFMIGHSRKRFLATNKEFGTPEENVDRYDAEVNRAAARIAINATSNKLLMLRVHDVAAHWPLINESAD